AGRERKLLGRSFLEGSRPESLRRSGPEAGEEPAHERPAAVDVDLAFPGREDAQDRFIQYLGPDAQVDAPWRTGHGLDPAQLQHCSGRVWPAESQDGDGPAPLRRQLLHERPQRRAHEAEAAPASARRGPAKAARSPRWTRSPSSITRLPGNADGSQRNP